jgi:hypothetical protein
MVGVPARVKLSPTLSAAALRGQEQSHARSRLEPA